MYHDVDVSRFFAVRKVLLLTFAHLTINTGTSTNIALRKKRVSVIIPETQLLSKTCFFSRS